MRMILPDKLRDGRVTRGEGATTALDGPNGIFVVQGPCGERLLIVASEGDEISEGFEHVSVSTRRRIPNWTEMCFVKDLFWEEEVAVFQLHPPKSTWISNVPNCLHLWHDTRQELRLPPTITVGIKEFGVLQSNKQAREMLRKVEEQLAREGKL